VTTSSLPKVRASELVGRGWLNTGGRAVSLSDLRGKVVVLDFWTFCCINCLHVLDELRELEARFADVLVVVGVHSPKFVHEADPDALAAAVERYEVHHPVLDDPTLLTWQAYTARAWPTLVVIDPEGYVVAHLAGEGHGPALTALVGSLVDEHSAKGTLRRGDGPYVPTPPTPGTLRFPAKAVALPNGNLLVADAGHHSLAELAPDGSTLVRRIGSGTRGWVDGPPDEARFAEPNGLCLVPSELLPWVEYDVVVADTANHLLRGVRLADGLVSTLAGTGQQYVVGGPDNETRWPDEQPAAEPGTGRQDVGGPDNAVPRRDEGESTPDTGSAPTPSLADLHLDGPTPSQPGPDGAFSSVLRVTGPRPIPELPPTPRCLRLSSPWDVVWFEPWAAFVVAMAGNHTLWAFDPLQLSLEPVAGTMNEGLLDGPAREAWFAQPSGLAVDDEQRLWVADSETSALRLVTGTLSTARVDTVVGAGLFDFGHRDGAADEARLQHPLGVAIDHDGSVLVADTYNGAVRRYLPDRVDLHAPDAWKSTHTRGAPDGSGSVPTVGEGGPEPRPDRSGSVTPVAEGGGEPRRVRFGSVTTVAEGGGEPRRVRSRSVTTVAEGLAEPSGLVVTAEGVLVVESAAHRITRLASSGAAAVDHGAHRTQRPVTDLAPGDLELLVPFTPAPGQKTDDRYGPSTQLSVSSSPPELLLDGAGDDVPLSRRLRLNPEVAEGVLHVSARAASCDADPTVEFPACHLAQQDWGVPVRLVAGAPSTLTLPLLGA
jgi:thiol-disulfide isomerase/thioredoxin